MRSFIFDCCLPTILGGLLIAELARAESVAVESFDYAADTNLAGAKGGSGWDGAWVISPLAARDNRVIGPTMSYLDLKVAGMRMEQSAGDVRSFRKLDLGRKAITDLVTQGDYGPALGKTGTTIWIGFLIAMPSHPRQAYGG